MGLKKSVFLFSGFGTQFDSMGENLYSSDEVFKNYMDQLDVIAIDISGKSVIEDFFDKKSSNIKHDLFSTLTMLYMVQYSLAEMYIEKGVEPDCLMGFSLGETVAASVSMILDPSDIISLFFSEAQVLSHYSFETETLFVYKSSEFIDDHPELFENSQVICNYSSSHSIISIPKDKELFFIRSLKEEGIISYKMPINIPFHTTGIADLYDSLFPLFEKLRMQKGKIPVISTLADHDKIQPSAEYFWNVICQRICFSEKLKEISDPDIFFIDCSPASACSNYVKYNKISNKCFSSPFYQKSNHKINDLNITKLINDIKTYQGKEY